MFALLKKTPLLLVSVFALTTASPVLAQDWDRGRVAGEAQQQAYDHGYRKGVDQGREDAEDRRAFDYVRQKDYRKADDGYKGRYGSREYYANEFRRGYVVGYRQGYGGYSRRYDNRYDGGGYYGNGRYYPSGGVYPNAGNYPNEGYGRAVPRGGYAASAGYNRGYNDGLQKGSEDTRKNRSYDPSRHGWYRSADRGYDHDYGSRYDYEASYRDGFERGYAQAYRGGR